MRHLDTSNIVQSLGMIQRGTTYQSFGKLPGEIMHILEGWPYDFTVALVDLSLIFDKRQKLQLLVDWQV